MHRRRLLSAAGITLTGLLAGCSGGDSSETDGETGTSGASGPDAATETSGSPGTTAAEPTSTSQPTTADQSTTTTTAPAPTAAALPATATTAGTTGTSTPDPGSTSTAGDSATVAFENGGSRVVVSGTIVAQDGCRRAMLDSTNSNDGTLVVSVGTERDAGTDTLCTQALTPVDYRFVLTPDSPPDSVRVVHAGPGGRRRVTTVDRSG